MVLWRTSSQPAQLPQRAASAGMEHSEEMIVEDVEEPDERRGEEDHWAPGKLNLPIRPTPLQTQSRRESLLTRQLHSETEHSDEDHIPPPSRALSTQSTWSNQSASTAELTSDDGRSMPSPAISPPLPPTHAYNALPIQEKPLDKKLKIMEQDEVASSVEKGTGSEKSVEATLGRKRCIMFACRGKDEAKPKPPSPTSVPAPQPEPAAAASPKRRCMIKFACPMRSSSDVNKTAEAAPVKRPVSPPPMHRTSSTGLQPEAAKTHRGSDSTVTHGSPRSVRKSSNVSSTSGTAATADTPRPNTTRKLSNDSDDTGNEATRFHEFASSEDEPEEWVKESTCHRSRLTISDTLKKENVIRKACEEVEEEAVEEDEEEAEGEAEEVESGEDDRDEEDVELDGDEGEDEDEESDHSDAGFHSDDEDGFAASDDEGEDSDYEWWKPGGSTAATSVEHLDRLHLQPKPEEAGIASSLNSVSSGQLSPHTNRRSRRLHRKTHAITIANRLQVEEDNDLPDSTDFVCGTLDEDRPLEQAYITRQKEKEAAKHKARPQDIDPTFPTSDPEMDEEDDEDIDDHEDSGSERERMMHGDMEGMGGENTLRHPRAKSAVHRSPPPPPTRYHSPPPSKRTSRHLSPAPTQRRGTARSPPPTRKLFGNSSPRCVKSPAPVNRRTSPPNTRRASPTASALFVHSSRALAERPQLTHTASLPRGDGFLLSRLGQKHLDGDDASDTAGPNNNEVPKRGAIDIVKGLEKKRQRRKEKMWQKMCAKNAAKGEKPHKVKPGKGCERMREVGLQLQQYHGKAQHILSL